MCLLQAIAEAAAVFPLGRLAVRLGRDEEKGEGLEPSVLRLFITRLLTGRVLPLYYRAGQLPFRVGLLGL